jgi:hypothetical protein
MAGCEGLTAQRAFDRPRNPLGQRIHLFFRFSLDHHSRERLSPIL